MSFATYKPHQYGIFSLLVTKQNKLTKTEGKPGNNWCHVKVPFHWEILLDKHGQGYLHQ